MLFLLFVLQLYAIIFFCWERSFAEHSFWFSKLVNDQVYLILLQTKVEQLGVLNNGTRTILYVIIHFSLQTNRYDHYHMYSE